MDSGGRVGMVCCKSNQMFGVCNRQQSCVSVARGRHTPTMHHGYARRAPGVCGQSNNPIGMKLDETVAFTELERSVRPDSVGIDLI